MLARWPSFDSDQIDSAMSVLASGKVNAWTGSETKEFEREFAYWCGSSNAIAIANGSLALSAAYLAVGLGHGDELITTPAPLSLPLPAQYSLEQNRSLLTSIRLLAPSQLLASLLLSLLALRPLLLCT